MKKTLKSSYININRIMKPAINQLLPNLIYGDAISNFALAIKEFLDKSGYQNRIFCLKSSSHNIFKCSSVKKIHSYDAPSNVIIFHYSIGSELTQLIENLKSKIVLIYYGITPSEYFLEFSDKMTLLSKSGIEDLKRINEIPVAVAGTSEFLRQELRKLNFKNIFPFPVMLSLDKYNISPLRKVVKQFRDGKMNFLTVGRISPHKKIEDVIQTFYFYKKYVNNNARLIIVGDKNAIKDYSDWLEKFCRELNLLDVIFTGKVSFRELISYYNVADIYISMSEHEGFCVPIIEAMHIGIPVLAFSSTAIPDTMGDAGIQFKEKDFLLLSELINQILTDSDLRENIIKNQKKHAEKFSSKNIDKYFSPIYKLLS